MSVSMLLPIHIAAGGLAMVLGALALSVKKGGTIPRRTGRLFVCAMIVMGFTAPILAFVLRAVHRGRLVLLGPRARGKNPSRAVHRGADARAADPAAVRRDVLLVVEGPQPPTVASARPTRCRRSSQPVGL